MTTPMSADELIAEITRSFQAEPYPGDLHIVTNNAPGYDLESLQIRETFKVHTWQTMPDDLLLYEQAALSLLSPQGFKYYLPAFLCLAVRHYTAADALPDSLIFHLTPPRRMAAVNTAGARNRPALLLTPQPGPHPDADQPTTPGRMVDQDWQADFFIARARRFNPAQGRAICHFLAYLRDAHGHDYDDGAPDTAIERYWFQFE